MPHKFRSPLGATAILLAGIVSAGGASAATAATSPLSDSNVTAHFDFAAGQTPENIVVEPNGSTDVTFVGSRQIAHVAVDGTTTVLATLPLPSDGGKGTPITSAAAPTGITRAADGTIFFAYAAGDSRFTGLWSMQPGEEPVRIAALPSTSFPNGISLDRANKNIYIADSTLGTVWKVRLNDGATQAWSIDQKLMPAGFAGANGLKVHGGAVWVTNTDTGSLLSIPIKDRGSAGNVHVQATGLTNVDDFAFTGSDNQVVAALFGSNELVLIEPNKKTTSVVLDNSDGLQNPTAVVVRDSTVTVASSARQTGTDPNLVTAHLSGR